MDVVQASQKVREWMLRNECTELNGLTVDAPAPRPRCTCCGTTENLHVDRGSGGPYRCGSPDCVSF